MRYSSGPFGQVTLPDNTTPVKVTFHRFESDNIKVTFLDLGCIIQSLSVKDNNGTFDDVALGFDTAQEYLDKHMYYGTVVGRVANRIKGGAFNLNGQTYQLAKNNPKVDGVHHLHGGWIGWGRRIWTVADTTGQSGDQNEITFKYVSPDNDEGYPCQVNASVKYIIDINSPKMTVIYQAKNMDETRSTLINLTNHSYFNLAGHKSFVPNLDHHQVFSTANHYTPNGAAGCPTGEIKTVDGNAFDLRKGVVLTSENLKKPGNGYDENFCFDRSALTDKTEMQNVFTMKHTKNGRVMKVNTNAVGAQLYTCNFFCGHLGKSGIKHERQSGFAIETQDYPNSVNMREVFPSSTIYGPGEEYLHKTEFEFQ